MSQPVRIMIVEDEMVVALDLASRLGRLGYDICDNVPSGEEAIRQVDTLRPDLVLMDISLSGDLDGIEAAQQMRTRYDLPIIYLTANTDETTLRRAQLTHPANYLLKPFKERELQICIEMALANYDLQRQLRAAREDLEHRVEDRTVELARANLALTEEIKERRRMEEQVRERAALLDKARDAIMVRKLDATVLYWNRSAERLYGYDQSEALGRNAAELLGENGDDHAAEALRNTLANGEWLGELRHRNRAGVELVVESRWTLVSDDCGQPRSVLVVNTDMTERRLIEAQFLRAQRLESIGALASGIAHDLNNVFTPLLMSAQILQEESRTPGSRQIADIVLASARRGADMVKQVLLFARGTDGEHLPFPFGHLVREVERFLHETLPPSIRMHANLEPGLWDIHGDAAQIHQILMNLCVNARDAMPDGGELRITASNFTVDKTFAHRCQSARPGDYLHITVSDTGVGMSAEARQRIFEPFFTTKEPGVGTGLGLSTVQTIVDNHHGFMDVKSGVGVGTQFHIYLPAFEEEIGQAKGTPPVVPRGNGELVLVVDDEHAVREINKATLEAFGYRALTADDGVEALSRYVVHRGEIALVVTDMLMPIMDGRATIRALRKLDARVPILAVGATEPDNNYRQFLTDENIGYLRKPCTKEQFLIAIHEQVVAATEATAG
jgi:PAS domain S-box-containing protein